MSSPRGNIRLRYHVLHKGPEAHVLCAPFQSRHTPHRSSHACQTEQIASHSKFFSVTFFNVKLSFIKSKSCSDHRNSVHNQLVLVMLFSNNWMTVCKWNSQIKNISNFQSYQSAISSRSQQILIVVSRFLVISAILKISMDY